ncbi:hypothetical protein H6G57_24320 [Planktothrix sp. FACHB-1365]|nr:hypothetical protein [Planktothrix sp. FACHB-1365]
MALALVLLGQIAHFLMPTGLSATEDFGIRKFANLMSVEPTNDNAVEVDGIWFEILVPERVLPIPEKEFGFPTPVKIGLRITNQKPTPIRLNRFDPQIVLGLRIVTENGLPVDGEAARGMFLGLRREQLTCPLLQSGKSVTFFLDANLYWQDNLLHLGGTDGLGGGWDFKDLKPGTYKIQFLYNNSSAVNYCRDLTQDRKTSIPQRVEGLWTGQATTPFVEVRLVQP